VRPEATLQDGSSERMGLHRSTDHLGGRSGPVRGLSNGEDRKQLGFARPLDRKVGGSGTSVVERSLPHTAEAAYSNTPGIGTPHLRTDRMDVLGKAWGEHDHNGISGPQGAR